MSEIVFLKFELNVEDDWPPVAVECLPFQKTERGYCTMAAPLFVKDLSVGDVILGRLTVENNFESWEHVSRSDHSTIWFLRLKTPNNIDSVLALLRNLGCNTVGLDSLGCYAVDVPADVQMADIDVILAHLDEVVVAVAFPSMRHPD